MLSSARPLVCGMIALTVAGLPLRARAAPAGGGADAAPAPPQDGAEVDPPTAGADADEEERGPREPDEVEAPPPPTVSGVAGNPVTDPENAGQAEAELEGRAPTPVKDVPERMAPLQAAGWWTLFAGVAIASVGGVMGGLAESEEDRARRLAGEIDGTTGAAPQYETVQKDYEDALDRGRAFEQSAWALVGVAGAAVITSVALFAAHGKRSRAEQSRVGPRGLEVRF